MASTSRLCPALAVLASVLAGGPGLGVVDPAAMTPIAVPTAATASAPAAAPISGPAHAGLAAPPKGDPPGQVKWIIERFKTEAMIRIVAIGSSNTARGYHCDGRYNWVDWLDVGLSQWSNG